MKENWETYCLMCSVAYIEEMSKPKHSFQIKKYKRKRDLNLENIKVLKNKVYIIIEKIDKKQIRILIYFNSMIDMLSTINSALIRKAINYIDKI